MKRIYLFTLLLLLIYSCSDKKLDLNKIMKESKVVFRQYPKSDFESSQDSKFIQISNELMYIKSISCIDEIYLDENGLEITIAKSLGVAKNILILRDDNSLKRLAPDINYRSTKNNKIFIFEHD